MTVTRLVRFGLRKGDTATKAHRMFPHIFRDIAYLRTSVRGTFLMYEVNSSVFTEEDKLLMSLTFDKSDLDYVPVEVYK